jgi:orotate phosphoribosyltransferase
MKTDKETVIQIIEDICLKFGDFTLASGAKSSYYIDLRPALLESCSLYQILTAMRRRLNQARRRHLNQARALYDAVACPVLGAVPLMSGLLTLDGVCWDITQTPGHCRYGLMVRSEHKDHGTGKLVEGWCPPDAKVLMVEDVVTSGGSVRRAVEAVQRELRADVIGVCAVLDREQGGQERIVGQLKLPYWPLVRVSELAKVQAHLAKQGG